MKKKIFTFLFAILIMPCAFMLTACGGKDPEHTHDYKTTWSTSATHHWHDCKGDGCTEKSGYAEHSYNNYVCECGYEDPNKPTDTDPVEPEPSEPADPSGPSDPGIVDPSGPHTCDFKTTWSKDATHHWHDCNGDDCTEKSGYAEHSYVNYECVCGHQDPNKPIEPDTPSTPVANKYADVVAQIKAEMVEHLELSADDVVVLMIDIDEEGKLIWWANDGTNIVKYKLNRTLTTETDGSVTNATIISLLSSALGPHFRLINTYSSYKTLTTNNGADATLINRLVQRIFGVGYNVIAGGISYGQHTGLPEKGDFSCFAIDLLLEKDGRLYEYNNSILGRESIYFNGVEISEYEAFFMGEEQSTWYKNFNPNSSYELVPLGSVANEYYEIIRPNNKYADVISTIIEQCSNLGHYPITDVHMIDVDEDGTLYWWASNNGSPVSKYKLAYGTIEMTNNVQANITAMMNALTNEELMRGDFVLVDTYTSDKTLTSTNEEDVTILYHLTNRLVGEGYRVLAGGVSNTYLEQGDHTLGDITMFDVDLLLEKDGVIYEYNDAIMAKRNWIYDGEDIWFLLYEGMAMDAYDAVRWGTENVTYKTQSELKTLGNLAKDYYAEG